MPKLPVKHVITFTVEDDEDKYFRDLTTELGKGDLKITKNMIYHAMALRGLASYRNWQKHQQKKIIVKG